MVSSCSSADVQCELAARRRRTEAQLRDRVARAIAAGEIRADGDAPAAADALVDALAGHVMAIIRGMSTLARDGATREKLRSVAAVAMHAWPEPPPALRATASSRRNGATRPVRQADGAVARGEVPERR